MTPRLRLGAGQVALRATTPAAASAEQLAALNRLSDLALSELPLDELLEELLVRVREALSVDTVAVLLLDEASDQLVARVAKGIEEEVERGVRIPIGQGFAGRIAAERTPIFIADVDHADILNPILREKGIRSLLGVPLVVEGDLIGVLHVGSLRPRTFDERDLTVLQLAAARVAPAMERARLFDALEREHEVAMVLQRSLLPQRHFDLVGATVAARYLPARDLVGGDWYDVIELPGGTLGITIGDVVGSGVSAASLMGQLRTALHAYALEGHGPGRTLELVDRFAVTLRGRAMATCACAVFDPGRSRLRIATAGHLPPIVVGSHGGRVVDLPGGPPLGAFASSVFDETELGLESDETIILYTDGLIERRGVPLDAGVEGLAELLAEAQGPEAACALAAELVPREGREDDIAIVALQGAASPDRLELTLKADSAVLAPVRRVLRRWLDQRGLGEEDRDHVVVAVNEACANSIEHAYPPGPATFLLVAESDENGLTFTVRDQGIWRSPRPGQRGRGLGIMEAAMDSMSIDRGAAGTAIVMHKRHAQRTSA